MAVGDDPRHQAQSGAAPWPVPVPLPWPTGSVEVHVYHHFDPIEIEVAPVRVVVYHPSNYPTHAKLEVNVSITVDTTNATVTLAFEDDKGDPTYPPAGVEVTFTTSDAGVITVGTAEAEGTTFVASLTPVGEGSATIGVNLTGPTGAPLLTEAGEPFPIPGSVTVAVGPGDPATATITVQT